VPLRLAALPGHDARRQASMNPALGFAIERVAETGSTNSDLLERVRAAAFAGASDFAPCLRVAAMQSAGRGRHGRTWHAAAGASLTFSVAWPFAGTDLSGLSLAIGTVLADSLDAATGRPRIGLKWPNDLCLLDGEADATGGGPGRKLAGVLIETAPFGAGRVAVVGVGINVLPHAVPDAAAGVAWLAEIRPDATPASTLERLLAPLAEGLRRFERSGFAAFADAFAGRDLLRGRDLVAAGPDGALEGLAAGVTPAGELLLQTAQGLRQVRSGEVRLRLAGPSDSGPARMPTGPTC